jgi:hypothetical protein
MTGTTRPHGSGRRSSPELRCRGRHRHPHGVSVRNKLGGLLQIRGRRGWPDARHGRHVRLFPRERFHRRADLGGEAAGPALSLPRGAGRRAGELAVRLLHPGDERLHAAPGRPSPRGRRHAGHCEHEHLPDEPLGLRAVRPQSDGGARDRLVRGRGRGGLLYPARTPSSAGAALPPRGNFHRADRVRAGGVPDGRPAGQDGWPAPAGHARGDGRAVRERTDGGRRADRPAERRGPPARQPHRHPRRPELPGLWPFREQRARPRRVPEGDVAGQPRAALLPVPPHDHAGDALRPPHGGGDVPELARPAGVVPVAALGAHAGVPLPVHRQHARVGDGGVGTPALASLRSLPHRRRLQQGGQ